MNEKSVSLPRRLVAESLGTTFLLAAVVGSGIMAQRLAGGNGALALLCNTLPTGAILTVLILTFGPVSGAHFNPAVSIAFALRREIPWPDVAAYVTVQIIGGVVGVWAAHAMFELPVWQVSAHGADGRRTMARRICRDFWIAANDFRLRCANAGGSSLRRRSVHYVGLLVHGVDIIRQSGRDHRAFAFRHLRGYRSRRRHCIYRRAAPWHAGGGAVSQLVLDQNEKHGRMTALPDRRVVIPALGITQIFGLDILFARRAGTADRKQYRLALRFDRRWRVGWTARCRACLEMSVAVAFGAIVGPAQVGARIIELLIDNRYDPVWAIVASAILVAIAALMMLSGFSMVALAIALYGARNGIGSVARGTVALACARTPPAHFFVGRKPRSGSYNLPAIFGGELQVSTGEIRVFRNRCP